MEEIVYETEFSLCERSNYISNYNNTNMCEVSKVICSSWLRRKHLKKFIERPFLAGSISIQHLVDFAVLSVTVVIARTFLDQQIELC